MLTRIDHVMICVPDLNEGIAAYTRIGFSVFPGGSHAGRATHNAIAFHEDDYLELLSLRDGECDHWAAVEPGARTPVWPNTSPGAAAFATSRCRATTWRPTWRRCAGAAST